MTSFTFYNIIIYRIKLSNKNVHSIKSREVDFTNEKDVLVYSTHFILIGYVMISYGNIL